MIKIKTKYGKETDDFELNYHCKKSHTMEHLCLIERLVYIILKNDEDMTVNEIFKLVKEMRKINEEK